MDILGFPLWNFGLAVRPGASPGAATINLLGDVRVGGGVFSTSLNDGHLTLTPAPTDSDLDPIDGSVTIAGAALTSATAPSRSSPRLAPAHSGLPAMVDRAIETAHGASPKGAGLDPASTVPSSTTALIPWTTSESSLEDAPAEELINPARSRTRNSKVTIAQATPDAPRIGR